MPNKFFGNNLPEFLYQSWLSLHAYLENQGPRSISRNINALLINIHFMVIKKKPAENMFGQFTKVKQI